MTAASEADVEAFADRVVQVFSRELEERELDETSAASFPASDPPATTPASRGPAAESDSETHS